MLQNTATSPAAANPPLRRASTHASTTTTASSRITPSIHTVGTRRSTDSRIPEEVLQDGDEIGPGLSILGQPISIVNTRTDTLPTLRVIRKLGTGSYAVVYLVQEMLPVANSASDKPYSHNFLEIRDAESPRVGGKYYALKCLAKHAQEQDAQLLEATIHQSLPVHPNVVTLWTTLETASYLLLVLDYVPGEDLFYFLEQARDHVDSSSPSSNTPPTPTFLASLHPEQILSHRRLRLIASMFSQMCDALAHCHRNGVYHRDIKPENFMITDGRVINEKTGENERKVQVKLTDFGLATRDAESGDMDCGSAPYMSYECHNNITPTYATAPADVWSLGIVLINMLYHANPWLSTAAGHCQSFESFLQDPRCFFMEKFPGMTPAVAEFFSRRVFCLLESPLTPAIPLPGQSQLGFVGRRITAEEFGAWARNLPLHLGPAARRTPALAFPPLQIQIPSPRAPSPTAPNGMKLMSPSISQPGTRTPSPSFHARPPMPPSPQPAAHSEVHRSETVNTADLESDEEDASRARTNSSSKRRKRAPRGKSQSTSQPFAPSTPVNEGTEAALYKASILAEKSQIVAREASAMNVGRTPPTPHATLAPVFVPPPAPAGVPMQLPTLATKRSVPELRRKKSAGWGAIFKRDSGSDQEVPGLDEMSPVEPVAPIPNTTTGPNYAKQTARAKQVSDVVMGLSPAVRSDPDDGSRSVNGSGRSSSLSTRGRRKERHQGDRNSNHREVSPGSLMSVSTSSTGLSWNRNKSAPSAAPGEGNNSERRGRSKSPTQSALSHFNMLLPNNAPSAPPVPTVPRSLRDAVPGPMQGQEIPLSPPPESAYSTSSYAPSSHRSYAPSIASVSTATTSSAFSAFSGKNKRASAGSRFSGSAGSVRSVSTAATSLSSGSWRNGGQMPPLPRTNVKDMDGVPTGLMDVPRQARHKPDNYVWREAGPSKKGKNGGRSAPASPLPGSSFNLEPIPERPKKSSMKPPRTAPERGIEALHSVGVIGDQRGPGYTSGGMGSFGQNSKSFSAGRGMPMGLYIDADTANTYASGTMDPIPVAAAPVKPIKTPTKSKFWGAFRKERA